MDNVIIPANDMKIPQYVMKSPLAGIGLKLYSYWILEDGHILSPADTAVHIAYILDGYGNYGDIKLKTGDIVAFGLNAHPIQFHVHKISMFILDLDFSLFYSLTGLEPCVCHNLLFLEEINPFYQLGQILFQHPVTSWIPIIESYIMNIFEKGSFPIESSTMERVVFAAKEIAKARDLHSIASDMAISIRQLQRDFHSILGISLNEYRIILRFYVAAHGLKNGSIADVAHEAGYYDQSHMSREFKKRSGWTPRQVSMHHYYEHK